jgi:hypothetical protein
MPQLDAIGIVSADLKATVRFYHGNAVDLFAELPKS